MDAEVTLGEVPEEFLDPIQVHCYTFLGRAVTWGSIYRMWKIFLMHFFAVHFDEGSGDFAVFKNHS
jgi:hypothetical protein